jgi:Zn-dependent protease with chaperone function
MKRLSLYGAFAVLFFSLLSFLILKPSVTRESAIPLMRSIGSVFKQLERLSSHLFPLSAEEERAVGNKIYKRYSFGAVSQSPYQDLIVPLRAKLMAPSPLVTRYPNKYVFVVIPRYSVVNAFALPGGLISIFDGLMKKFIVETPKTKPTLANADALAFIMAHEIGHVELLGEI